MRQLETQVQDVCQVVNAVMSLQESPLLPAHPRGDCWGGTRFPDPLLLLMGMHVLHAHLAWPLTQHVSCSLADFVSV